jgi:gliding motility-associated-like protein
VSSQVTVNVGAGLSPGEDSTVAVCGSDVGYALFNALGGSPATGGTWDDLLGTGALLPGGLLNASLLPEGTNASYAYTVTDPGCGELTAVVQVTISPFPDAGTGRDLIYCATDGPQDLFAQLGGTPQSTGAWTGPTGQGHSGTFVPGQDAPGAYTYTVPGNAVCAPALAVLNIIVNQPANAGTDSELTVCDTLTALDLFTALNGTPQTGGDWEDLSGSGGLTGGSLNTTALAPGEYPFRYEVIVVGCGSAAAIVTVEVVTNPRIVDLVRTCNERDRSYTVSFSIAEGDTASYQVTGLAGTIIPGTPYTFISDPITTTASFSIVLTDDLGCGSEATVGGSPCDFQDDVFVPQSFSPNGDNTNEVLLIPGIEGFPSNRITIFNRWGGKVYEASGYNNSSVLWNGSSPDAIPAGNAPAGTYFYVLDLGNGREALTGYIYLNR